MIVSTTRITDKTAEGKADEEALFDLLQLLKQLDYWFVTPTPATHARILKRREGQEARDLRDVLGWSLPFDRGILHPEIFTLLETGDALRPLNAGLWQSRYRASTLGAQIFLHSAYPTHADDSVFFGPDSYRFADLIRSEFAASPPPAGALLVDVGAGAGVGALTAAKFCPELRVLMTDINPEALRLARINARAAGIEARYAVGPYLEPVSGMIDIALANPPYIIDAAGRDYRDGGDMLGARVAYEMAVAAAARLSRGGRFILYTGSAIVDGEDPLRRALDDLASREGLSLRYWEIDPDVFGEELARPAYADVERIALVGTVITRLG